MSFLRSLFSGVSGLRNHQLMMDVIGNNIANINTVGFKASRVTFDEMFSQTLEGGTQPTDGNGGSDPIQVGLGMATGSVSMLFSQGNIETTGNSTDLAIQGNGFFIVKQDGKQYYTRDGSFSFDANGDLVNGSTGAIVQGKLADANGTIPAGTQLQDLKIALDTRSAAKATSDIKFSGNLDSSANTGDQASSSVTVYDSLGNQHTLTVTFTKSATANQWTWTADVPSPSSITAGGSGTVTFNADGTMQSFTYDSGTSLAISPGNGAAAMSVALDTGSAGVFSGITQTQGASNVSPREQDGYASGSLNGISIDQNGQIQGNFSNGTVQTLGQVMIAEFNNPQGLLRTGDNLYDVTGNSGLPVINSPADASNSKIVPGGLEQSNVDLADEFTEMIMAQRGFQANAKVITTSDEFLNDVVNLKR
ncbi:MAG TPA: flagellar hook protein FlgE [Bacteroidota bacterium]|nr:flagellar hook protein FlgE [Bacteroidota bacterium]